MEIFLREPVENMNEFLPQIMHLFPGKEFQVPFFFKKRLLIYDNANKAAALLILKDNGTRIVVKGQPNMKNSTNMGLMIFGILCSFGMIIALIVIYGMGGEERRRVATEAYELIKNEVE